MFSCVSFIYFLEAFKQNEMFYKNQNLQYCLNINNILLENETRSKI